MKTLVRHMREVQDDSTGETYFLNKKDYLKLRNANEPVSIIQNGGYTEALAYSDSGKLIGCSRAYCNPSDTFNRKIGRAIATGRLSKKLYSTKQHTPQLRPSSQDVTDFVLDLAGLGAGVFNSRPL